MKKRRDPKFRGKRPANLVRLEDLAPRKAVRGGGRLLFGERAEAPADEAPPTGEDRLNPPD